MNELHDENGRGAEPAETRWTERRGLYRLAYLALGAISLIPLWSVKYPPMVDLPQHAAQVFLWHHYDDPDFEIAEIYEINLATPYLLGYSLTRAFVVFLPVLPAMKLVLSLYVVALPWSMARLADATGADRWWSLLGFPLAYGFAFHWGLFNYLLALPVAVSTLTVAWRHAFDPTARRAWTLLALSFVLFLSHVLAYGIVMAAAGVLLVATADRPRRAVRRFALLLPSAALALAWLLSTRFGVDRDLTSSTSLWGDLPLRRLVELPQTILSGIQGEAEGPLVFGIAGAILLALPLVFGRLLPFRRPGGWLLGRWAPTLPLLVAILIFLGVPNRAFGTWFVAPRLAVFVPILLLAHVGPAVRPQARHLGRILTLALIPCWMFFLTTEFLIIDREARGLDELLPYMEPNRNVVGLPFIQGYSLASGVPVFTHSQGWYSVGKGGRAEYSFAASFPQIIRYRPGRGPLTNPDLSLDPRLFEWSTDQRADYFLAHAVSDVGESLFRDADAPVRLVATSGNWWLYERLPRQPLPHAFRPAASPPAAGEGDSR